MKNYLGTLCSASLALLLTGAMHEKQQLTDEGDVCSLITVDMGDEEPSGHTLLGIAGALADWRQA